MRAAVLALLVIVGCGVAACSESNVDACIRNCEKQFPHDGAARASCQLDCSSRRATGNAEGGSGVAEGASDDAALDPR